MSLRKIEVESTGEALLAVLADRGVDYLFGNAGTDFPPIIEALSKAAASDGAAPIPITCPTRTSPWPWPTGSIWQPGGPRW